MMTQRDEKGRFTKGNTLGKRFKPGDGQKEIASRGGKASIKSRNERRSIQQQAEAVWYKVLTNQKGEQEELGMIALTKVGMKALDGNEKSIELLAKLMGQFININQTEVTGRDGKDLIPDNKDELLLELERLKEATR